MTETQPSSGFQQLDREGLVQRVAKLLSKAIVSGKLAPGARLSESVVARELGVSRAPVREAARLLESSGLVTSEPNRGFFVRQISAKALDDLYELRLAIEIAVIQRLVQNWNEETEAALSAQVEALHRVATLDADIFTQVEADMQFHRLMCTGSGNPKFLTVFEQIAIETEFSIMLIGQLYDDPTRIAETHEPILEALRAQDTAMAIDAIRYHICEAQRIVTKQFRILEEGKTSI
ncbi:GntR family transcriptional regulator [Thalassospira sp.]|jgi:DNA-binding GntR family transcriptional regulator|uniref:GntR family transcriptional regulator n=1 Tax=Thalassospira sp. TaxID=1912094 RepID=UPI001B03892C|nr:GntR family transcriptional regulator [Thalassospira sp.]MBO6806773.1 GntR family transcriptional regulator [Thalassospira sp.]MBO6840395.1 GntR family transcriptional regulator [Thalassospira sp.]